MLFNTSKSLNPKPNSCLYLTRVVTKSFTFAIGATTVNAQKFFNDNGAAGTAVDFTMTSYSETGSKQVHLQTELNAGKIVLLDYFFTTCFYCQVSAPELEDIYTDFGPTGSNKLEILSLDVNTSTHSSTSVASYISTYSVSNPMFDIASHTSTFYGAPYHTNSVTSYGLPHFIAICPDGSWASLHQDDAFPASSSAVNASLRSLLTSTCPGVALDVVTIDPAVKVAISPNPATNNLTVNYTNNNTVTVNMVNVLGETVYTATMNSEITIDISKFNKGIYFVNIIDNNEKVTQKVIVQ